MANDKLQQLTERLYSEGLSKGQQEGEKILQQAKQQAQTILGKAEEEAAQIISRAQEQAGKDAAKAASDIRMASTQAIDATKAAIENIILTKAVDEKVSETLSDEKFIKDIISEVARRFTAESSDELELILPESIKSSVGEYVRKELSAAIGSGIKVSSDKKLKEGFCIGPSDGKYFVSFSQESFCSLIREYLRPATRKMLFGE